MNTNPAQFDLSSLLKDTKEKRALEGFQIKDETPFLNFVKEVTGIKDRVPTETEFNTLVDLFKNYLADITRFLTNSLEYIEKIRHDDSVFRSIDEYGDAFIKARIDMNKFDINTEDSFDKFQAMVKQSGFSYEVLRSLLTKAHVVSVV